MIIPINNGRMTTPIYIPQPVVPSNSGMSQQSNTNMQNNEPTLGTWIVLGVVLIFCIAITVYFVKLLKDFLGGKE